MNVWMNELLIVIRVKVECDGEMRQCDAKCGAMLCVMRCDVRSGEMSEVQSAKWVERSEMRMGMMLRRRVCCDPTSAVV